jgi:hypothetical protein
MAGAACLLGACSNTDETIDIAEIPFDGSSLGACAGDASKIIHASECNPSCPGTKARAFCVGNVYNECACLPVPPCDAGCSCLPSPVACKGNVAMKVRSYREYSPAEKVECDTDDGYLLCNGTCYLTFSCELPEGYSVVVPDAGHERGVDGGRRDGASSDAGVDASLDSGDAGGLDADADAGMDSGGSRDAAEAGRRDAKGD